MVSLSFSPEPALEVIETESGSELAVTFDIDFTSFLPRLGLPWNDDYRLSLFVSSAEHAVTIPFLVNQRFQGNNNGEYAPEFHLYRRYDQQTSAPLPPLHHTSEVKLSYQCLTVTNDELGLELVSDDHIAEDDAVRSDFHRAFPGNRIVATSCIPEIYFPISPREDTTDLPQLLHSKLQEVFRRHLSR